LRCIFTSKTDNTTVIDARCNYNIR